MAKKDKIKCIISDRQDPESVGIEWSYIGSNIVNDIHGKFFHNVLSINDNGELVEKTVIYLKEIKRFSRGLLKLEDDNLILGI